MLPRRRDGFPVDGVGGEGAWIQVVMATMVPPQGVIKGFAVDKRCEFLEKNEDT